MSAHFDRGQMLYQQGRLDMAVDELRLAVGENPDDFVARTMLALVYADLDRLDEADVEANAALGLIPYFGLAHYAKALIAINRKKYKKALESIDAAIEIEPEDAHYHTTKAQIFWHMERRKEALEAIDVALSLDAENVNAINVRAMLLRTAGRFDEAAATESNALERDPESELGHCNRGWTLLHTGDHKKAAVHFKEALRIDPDFSAAQQGLLECLKARNPLYRQLQRYYLWSSRLPRQWIVGLVVGAIFLSSALREGAAVDGLYWIFRPVQIAFMAFCWSTWLGDPLMHLFLLPHPLGRWILTPNQKKGAILCALALFAAFVCWLSSFTSSFVLRVAGGSIGSNLFVCSLPISAIYSRRSGWPRRLVAVLCFLSVFVVLMGPVVLQLALWERINLKLAAYLVDTRRLLMQPLVIGALIAAAFTPATED